MPGYRLANVDKNNLDTKYFCNLCELLLRDAIQTECGHFYCESCLKQCFKNSTTPFCCAVDGNVLHQNKMFQDRFMRREILGLMVSCPFLDEGCIWTGDVQHLEDHTAVCKFLKIPCVYDEACGVLVKRGDLADHLRMECRCRPEKCRFCDKEINYNVMKEHLQLEHNYLHYEMDNLRDVVDDVLHVQDNLRDEQRDLRDRLQDAVGELQEYLAGHGQLQNRQEDLQNAILVLQESLAEITRSRDEQKIEGDLLYDKVANLEGKLNRALSRRDGAPMNGIAERTLALGSRELGDVERQAENTQGTARRMDRQVESMEDTPATRRLTNLENRVADCEVLVDRTIEEARHDVRSQERRIESIEHTLELRNVTLADLEEYARQQEFSSYDGQLLWKISDYARRRNDAVTGQQVSLYSPCFYTSRYGYKMCARLYLNGDGMGKGTHISVFFVVMRGQYDALLRWPFRQKVTFMLLDQDNVEHVIDAFRPDPSSSSFQRPRRETNIASGCPMFCTLTELDNHAYVRDDTMFLKIIVDTAD